MEDSDNLTQDLPGSLDIEFVDASVQQPKKAQDPRENGKSAHMGSTDDMGVGEAPLVDNRCLTNKSGDNIATGAKVDDTGRNEQPESNGNGSQIGAAKPLPCGQSSALKAGEDNARTPKNGVNDVEMAEADEGGTKEEQAAFILELENFYRERPIDFKAPKFYGEPLNCLKLWRAVIRLGGYEMVTANKLWRQVGESFNPPKTCTTVSWTFRIFYEKALLEYEKHKVHNGEIQLPVSPFSQPTIVEKEVSTYQTPASGRAPRRDAAARAMQGWHTQRLLGYGEVTEPIVKDKSYNSSLKREKNLKSIGAQKQKAPSNLEHSEKAPVNEVDKQLAVPIVDGGPSADWVKITVRQAKDCFEVYALVPGLLREEVRIQSDPAGRLVITGTPEQLDNPWGITPFQKVVTLPGRIDPLQTSAVVSLHGRLFVRVPFELGSA